MKTFFLQIAGLFILIIVGLMVSTNRGFTNPVLDLFPRGGGGRNVTNQLVITDSSGQTTKAAIDIEIAQSQEAKSLGLGNRESLATNSGMIFIYEKPDKYRFWMKGMRFPIDFIWIKDDQVVDLLPNISPPDAGVVEANLPIYTSITEANKILEVNAGFIAAHNIIVGDLVKY